MICFYHDSSTEPRAQTHTRNVKLTCQNEKYKISYYNKDKFLSMQFFSLCNSIEYPVRIALPPRGVEHVAPRVDDAMLLQLIGQGGSSGPGVGRRQVNAGRLHA